MADKKDNSQIDIKKNLPTGKIAMGAAGVAIAAGVVVAGAMLADKKNRQKTANAAKKGFKLIKDAAQSVAEEIEELKEEELTETPPVKMSSSGKKKKSP